MNYSDNDFELCNETWRKIVETYGDNLSITEFSEFERIVVLVWTVTGLIENGGFGYLFESDLPGDKDLVLSLEAFDRIGCKNAKQVIIDVLKRIECIGNLHTSKLERYKTLPNDEQNQLDSKFGVELDNINKGLADFIRNRGAR